MMRLNRARVGGGTAGMFLEIQQNIRYESNISDQSADADSNCFSYDNIVKRGGGGAPEDNTGMRALWDIRVLPLLSHQT